MSKKLSPFDSSDYLDDSESIAAYLKEYLAAGASSDELLTALGRIARAKGMSDVARKAGLGRESLYKALAAGSRPEWSTVVKVLGALGLVVQIAPAELERPRRRRAGRKAA